MQYTKRWKNMIQEVIIVEGRDDEAAVKNAVDAEVIVTHGYGISKQTYNRIEKAYTNTGIIIFTDPDYAGEGIRRKLSNRFPNAKHAFLSKEEAKKDKDIGIENALPESIINALEKARPSRLDRRSEFSMDDLNRWDLSGSKNASYYREKVGKLLGIGYGNTKTFLNRLNNYNISREEFENVVTAIVKINKEK